MTSASVVVVTAAGGPRLARALESLAAQTVDAEVIVVANAVPLDALATPPDRLPVEVVSLEKNIGFGRAVNLAARRAGGDALVLVNDDCVCEPQFVQELIAALDPAAGVVMAAGVLTEARDRRLIDTAGMELDDTLLVFDYLNGEPLELLEEGSVPDPIGPCGAAAAFDREAFLRAGGFDEAFFAYWEDVDLVLRLRREGARCALAPRARGVHEHSATLGPGSARKNYLVGFGRGYVLRKWSVLASPTRAARALARDVVLSAGQAVVDRNFAGARGRFAGYAAARAAPSEPYPAAALASAPGLAATLAKRLRRRSRLRAWAAR